MKVVQRISVQPTTGINVTLSFDDTPGLEDTKYASRERNAALMRNYGAKYYPEVPTEILGLHDRARGKTYPNLIILAASWDSVKMDDNEPADFTSSIGKTIYYLTNTDLIDHQHPNVVVVVTKSLTFWCDYDDFDSEEEKGEQWQRDADEKSTIINDLRSKTFPSSNPWPVIFVENGGGKKVLQRHRTLPNGELSHQNLFQAIAGIMTKAQDLVGIQALRFVTGAESVMSQLEITPREILCQCEDPGVPSEGAVAVSFVPNSHSLLLMVLYFRRQNLQTHPLLSTQLLAAPRR